MPTPPRLAALLTAAYFSLGLGSLQLLALQPPGWLEQLISLFAAPAVVLLVVWVPLLRPFGLTSGEYLVLPNGCSTVVLVALYTLAVYALVAWLRRRLPHN